MITLNTPQDTLSAMRAKTIPFEIGVDYMWALQEILGEPAVIEKPLTEEQLLPEREGVYSYFQRVIRELFKEYGDDATFEYLFGGSLKVCESEEDLIQVEGIDLDWAAAHDHKWPNVMDMPMSWDHAGYLNDDEKSGWFVFLLCTSIAGGDVFYVPERLWERARVKEHLECHNNAWAGITLET